MRFPPLFRRMLQRDQQLLYLANKRQMLLSNIGKNDELSTNTSLNYCHGRLATIRLLGERSEPFLAAKRPTASDDVARGRLVSLAGFSIAFRAKNGGWRDSHLGFQVSFASP